MNKIEPKEQWRSTNSLSNEFTIPVVGTGTNTYGKEGKVFSGAITHDTTELQSAIVFGYHWIDTSLIHKSPSKI